MDSEIAPISWPNAWIHERDRFDELYSMEQSLRRPHAEHPLLKTVAQARTPQGPVQHERHHYHIDALA